MKITDFRLVDGIPLINQYLKSEYQPYGSPHIEASGRVLQVMVCYEKEPEIQLGPELKVLQAKTAQDIKAAKGK